MITKKSKNLDFQKIDTFELINMETCPITGLAITCKDSWKNIVLTSDYEVSFAIIGSNILLSIPKGDAGTKGKIRFIEARNLVLKEQGLWDKPHIEIKDYKRVNALVSSEARQQFTSHMVSEHLRGHLQAFYGFNAKFAFQFMLRIGQFIFPNIHHIPMEMVKDYHQAISRVFKLMKMTDSFNQNRPPSIEYKDDIYQVSFKLLDDDIIYNEASGTLLDTHIDIFFKYFSQFLQENNLQGKEYYRIVNWQGLTYSSWKAKKDYINQLNKFQKETPCAFTALYNLSPFMKNILRMGRPFVPFEYIFCNTLNESLDKIYEFKEGKHAKLTKDYEKRIYTQKQIDEYSAELLDKIKDINWDNAINGQINSISQTEQEKQLESLSKDNPLQLVFEAISILKMDIAHAIYDKSEVEKKLFLANKLSTLGEVAAGVGHEINNPLTIMLGFCSNLLEKIQKDPNAIAPHEIKLTLEKIASAGQRIKQIVGSLKMHSRKNGDDHNLFSLMQSLDATTKLSNILFANASINFNIEISPKAQEIYSQINIMGDKVKFQQVLFNFFNNAKDAIIEKKEEQGLIKIIIDKNTSSNQSEQFVFIHISDNGIGIPQENFSKIFDAFYTTKPIGRGTGLGLSIAHSIITEMNGNLEFTSVVGEGSIFKISLPYQLG